MLRICICTEKKEDLATLALKTKSLFDRRGAPTIYYNLLDERGCEYDFYTIGGCEAVIFGLGWEKNERARLAYDNALQVIGLPLILFEYEIVRGLDERYQESDVQIDLFTKIERLKKENAIVKNLPIGAHRE